MLALRWVPGAENPLHHQLWSTDWDGGGNALSGGGGTDVINFRLNTFRETPELFGFESQIATPVEVDEVMQAMDLDGGGDVRALAWNGLLRILGDEAANQIAVEQIDSRTIRVTPLNKTLLNGQPEALEFGRISGIGVEMHEGDDLLRVDGTQLRGNLTVEMGVGDNAVLLDGIDVGGMTDIRTSGAATIGSSFDSGVDRYEKLPQNVVSIDSSTFMGTFYLETSQESNDLVQIDRSHFEARTEILTRQGGDVVQLGMQEQADDARTFEASDFFIDGGSADGVIGNVLGLGESASWLGESISARQFHVTYYDGLLDRQDKEPTKEGNVDSEFKVFEIKTSLRF